MQVWRWSSVTLCGWPVAELEQEHPLWNTWVREELVRVGREMLEREKYRPIARGVDMETVGRLLT